MLKLFLRLSDLLSHKDQVKIFPYISSLWQVLFGYMFPVKRYVSKPTGDRHLMVQGQTKA